MLIGFLQQDLWLGDTEAVTATSGTSRWLQGQEPEQPVASLGEWGGDEGLRNSCSPNFFPERPVENTISQTVRGFNECLV